MKLATPMGALSGNRVQVSLPAVVSMTAVGKAAEVTAGLAATAVAGFFAGVAGAAGVVCDQLAEQAIATSKLVKKHFRMDAPERRALPGRAGEDTCPYVSLYDCEIRFYPRVRKKIRMSLFSC